MPKNVHLRDHWVGLFDYRSPWGDLKVDFGTIQIHLRCAEKNIINKTGARLRASFFSSGCQLNRRAGGPQPMTAACARCSRPSSGTWRRRGRPQPPPGLRSAAAASAPPWGSPPPAEPSVDAGPPSRTLNRAVQRGTDGVRKHPEHNFSCSQQRAFRVTTPFKYQKHQKSAVNMSGVYKDH